MKLIISLCAVFIACFNAPSALANNRFVFEPPHGKGVVARPDLPDLSMYTATSLIAKKSSACDGKPASHASALKDMLTINELKTFTEQRTIGLWLKKQGRNPQALTLNKGCFTLQALAERYPSAILSNADGSYTARVPIVVQKKATFILEKAILKLSINRGVFLSSSGEFFAIDSKVLGWDEKAKSPSAFTDHHTFRPFYVGWSGSHTWMLRSEFSYLGYFHHKSYGVSFSQYRSSGHKAQANAPSGWILDCIFKENYYGFYTHEASHIVVMNSQYIDNIIYGIDPHDFSHDLIFAYNEVYGTKVKHGLIFSRSVTDSWVIGNHLHHNHGSGLVMDRQSSKNFMINNIAAANGGDGFSYYESPHNISLDNQMSSNKRHGFYIRNSTENYSFNDTIQDNARIGIILFSEPIPDRDNQRDPYEQLASLAAFNTKLYDNKTGIIKTSGNLDWLELSNIDVRNPVMPFFRGTIQHLEDAIMRNLFSGKRQIRIKRSRSDQGKQSIGTKTTAEVKH